MGYYGWYHILKDAADEARRQRLGMGMGMDALKAEASVKRYMEISTRGWPEPYRSCRYTPEEKLAFLMDPFGSAAWINSLKILGV